MRVVNLNNGSMYELSYLDIFEVLIFSLPLDLGVQSTRLRS